MLGIQELTVQSSKLCATQINNQQHTLLTLQKNSCFEGRQRTSGLPSLCRAGLGLHRQWLPTGQQQLPLLSGMASTASGGCCLPAHCGACSTYHTTPHMQDLNMNQVLHYCTHFNEIAQVDVHERNGRNI